VFPIHSGESGEHADINRSPNELKTMVALVVLKNKAIKPLLAAAQNLCPSRSAQNPRALRTIRKAMQAVFQEWDLLPEHR
jgi:hypothetical protein